MATMKNLTLKTILAVQLIVTNAHAAPLKLSDKPLFLATNAPPANVLFLFDDSGSMDWMTVAPSSEESGVMHLSCSSGNSESKRYVYTHEVGDELFSKTSANGGRVPTDELVNSVNNGVMDNQGMWRAYFHGYNSLYYNPEISYRPWGGTDNASNIYGNAEPSSIRIDPSNASSPVYDLTSVQIHQSDFACDLDELRSVAIWPARYFKWTDTNGDSQVDPTDDHQLIEIRTSNHANCSNDGLDIASCPTSFTRGKKRTDCDAIANGSGNLCTDEEELQNFANWFQYYRKREFTAKAAYTLMVNDASGINMGLVTLHNNNNVKLALSSMSNDNNRNNLLNSLYSINSSGGTPLQQASLEAYEYLACKSNDYFSSCPQASEAEGGMCQQNFLVAMTDGYYNSNSNFALPGTQNEDRDNNTDYDGGPYADNYKNTLADIAMDFYEHDIATNLDNVLPVIPGIDEARHQHVNTFTVAFGVEGRLNEMPDVNVDGTNYWPDPEPNQSTTIPEKIDDLRHAAFNGRGQFLNARSPDQLVSALSSAILSIGDRASSAASVALSTSSLNNKSHLYQARFDSGDWSGQLLAYPISDGSGTQGQCTNVKLGNTCPLLWDAGEVLKGQSWDTDRNIITIDPGSRTTGIAFRWDALTNTQKTALRSHPDSGSLDSEIQGKRRLAYVRGYEFTGNNNWRQRSSPLGDIVNSDPFFVGSPQFHYSFNQYGKFRSDLQNRQKVVYVGSNDGMLHAFNEADGKEVLAYVPGDRRIINNLSQLASTRYATRHTYFVDGSPTVGDIYTGTNGTNWKTVLVSGLRNGGQSVFALDITDPNQFAESNADDIVLWEFSDKDDPDLGFTHSQPNIVRMANGKWAAVIGNGYNNSDKSGHETGTTVSNTGKGYLFILFMDGPGADGVWQEGNDYIKLEVNSGSVNTPNGLATAATVDINQDEFIDVIYAGDINGNLWRFNVDDVSPGNWAVSYNGDPLYIAKDKNDVTQPITVRPEVAPHPLGIDHGMLVFFGTGRYIDESDNATSGTQTQTFYGIWDENSTTRTVPTRSNLVEQKIIDEVTATSTHCSDVDDCFRLLTDNKVTLDGSGHRGWFLDIVNTAINKNKGERVVSNPVLRAGRIVFSTLIPSGEICEFGGSGWLMELAFSSGGRPTTASIDVNGDDAVNEDDQIIITINGDDIAISPGAVRSKVGIIPRPSILVIPDSGLEKKFLSGSTGDIGYITETGYEEGRLSWREVH